VVNLAAGVVHHGEAGWTRLPQLSTSVEKRFLAEQGVPAFEFAVAKAPEAADDKAPRARRRRYDGDAGVEELLQAEFPRRRLRGNSTVRQTMVKMNNVNPSCPTGGYPSSLLACRSKGGRLQGFGDPLITIQPPSAWSWTSPFSSDFGRGFQCLWHKFGAAPPVRR
jgi:hypothetical protein